jgi:hypothetical protein
MIYVVVSGEYDDYQIDAVFSTKKRAENWIDLNGGDGIEEWELDPFCDEDPGLDRFVVSITSIGTTVHKVPRLLYGRQCAKVTLRTWRDCNKTSVAYTKKLESVYTLRWIGYALNEKDAVSQAQVERSKLDYEIRRSNTGDD